MTPEELAVTIAHELESSGCLAPTLNGSDSSRRAAESIIVAHTRDLFTLLDFMKMRVETTIRERLDRLPFESSNPALKSRSDGHPIQPIIQFQSVVESRLDAFDLIGMVKCLDCAWIGHESDLFAKNCPVCDGRVKDFKEK